DPALVPARDGLDAVSFQLAEVSAEIARCLGGLDVDSAGELGLVQQRRAELAAFARKHGAPLDEVIASLEQAGLRLVELDGDDERIARLADEVEQARAHLEQLAERGTERSEEHTSELQSRENLVCRLLLEKKKTAYMKLKIN